MRGPKRWHPSVQSELRLLSRLAVPMMISQLAQMGMGVADTVMAGRVSATDLAGVALGGNLYWPVLMLLTGIVMSVTPSVAQLHGRGHAAQGGEVVRQALWIGFTGGALLIVLLNNVEPIYQRIGVDPRAIPIAASYLHALSWGLLPVLVYFALRYLCEGLSWTRPAMIITTAALLLKIPLNYVFIYGVPGWGIEPMGGAGCGWASAIVMWFQCLAMVLVAGWSRVRVARLFARFSLPDPAVILRLLRLGLPIGATLFLEMSMFSAVTLLIGRIGVDAVAAHQIAGNVAGLTFMVPLALGQAASVRVGFNVGAGNLAAARHSGWTAISVAVLFALCAAALLLLFADVIPTLYARDPAVVQLAASLLWFVAFFQLFDDVQVTAIGSLRGYKDTSTPMWIAIVAYWLIGFPTGVMLAFGWFDLGPMGVKGFWWGLLTGLGVAACVLLARFYWLSRNEPRVTALAAR